MLAEIQSARECLAAVRAMVLSSSPEEVDGCIPQLQEAIACLHRVQRDFAGNQQAGSRADLARELSALHFELGVAGRLAARGAEFYQGWAKVVATAAAGYTATGDPAPLAAARSLSVEG